jgi:hypothetical protein
MIILIIVDKSFNQLPSIVQLEYVFLLHQSEDKHALIDEFGCSEVRLQTLSGRKYLVHVVVQPDRDIQLFDVDPLLESEDRTIVDVKLVLRVFQDVHHFVVEITEVADENLIDCQRKSVQLFLYDAHKPLHVQLDIFILSKFQQLQNRQGEFIEKFGGACFVYLSAITGEAKFVNLLVN